jgi:4'-phosphopantetheinyl transferase
MTDRPSTRGTPDRACPAVEQCTAPARLAPGDNSLSSEAHVIRIPLDRSGDGAALLDVLDAGERSRAARFINPHDRRRYIVAHAMMRTMLGRYLGVAAAALRFESAPAGKPRILGSTVEFSLSHSGERALLAMTGGGAIGVDIEAIDAMVAERVSHRSLSAAEQEALMAIDSDLRVPAFFRCWTRKESFVKAIGEGLRFPLNRFDVAVGEHVGNALLRCDVASIRADEWRVLPLATEAGYAAAVTVTSGVAHVWQWDAPDV